MSESEIPKLLPSLRALVEAERGAPEVDAGVASRVWKRVDATIASGGGTEAVGAEPVASAGPGVVGAFGLPALVAAFVAGGVAGAVGHFAATTRGDHAPDASIAVASSEIEDVGTNHDAIVVVSSRSSSSSIAAPEVAREQPAAGQRGEPEEPKRAAQRSEKAAPDTVTPAPFSGATLAGGSITVTLPAKSVVVLELR